MNRNPVMYNIKIATNTHHCQRFADSTHVSHVTSNGLHWRKNQTDMTQ